MGSEVWLRRDRIHIKTQRSILTPPACVPFTWTANRVGLAGLLGLLPSLPLSLALCSPNGGDVSAMMWVIEWVGEWESVRFFLWENFLALVFVSARIYCARRMNNKKLSLEVIWTNVLAVHEVRMFKDFKKIFERPILRSQLNFFKKRHQIHPFLQQRFVSDRKLRILCLENSAFGKKTHRTRRPQNITIAATSSGCTIVSKMKNVKIL